MKIPIVDCKIQMSCMINPSEDPEKIKHAISNVFPYSITTNDAFFVISKSKELRSFEKIHEAIHTNNSQNIYGRNLENNLENNSTWFFLNRQAAFVEKIILCDQAEESPLGPITVTVTSSNIDRIIDWLIL